jgi:MEMO1 family protein
MTDVKPGPAPRMRQDLELFPMNRGGKRAVVLRDPLGLFARPVLVEGQALALLGLLDGRRTAEDIQLVFTRSLGGVFVQREAIQGMIDELDAAMILDSPAYRRAKNRLVEEYESLDVREACLAGQSYPEDPDELTAFLDEILSEGRISEPGPHAPPLALAAPHIDIRVGKKVYGSAYGALGGISPKTVVLLGTGHSLEGGYYSLTEKDFQTPLGPVRTDRDSVRRLRRASASAVAAGDLAHRREHSLELQAIFLKRLFGEDFTAIPILCGSFQGDLDRVSRPREIARAAAFLDELRTIVSEGGRDVLCVAAVDFFHIGPKFGHDGAAERYLYEAEAHDASLLRSLLAGDVEGFWSENRRVRDRFNICGFSALASLLEILPPAEGRLLGRDVWREEETRSAVSFAAVAFHEKATNGV